MTAPLPENELERLDALMRYQILDTPAEDVYDDITRLAAHLCGTPIAAITFLDAERQWYKSIVGVEVQETVREIAFCAHSILQPGLLLVPNTRRDRRFADNPFVTGEPYVQFYASVPLMTSEGYAIGSLCVADIQPRTLSAEQQDALQILAHQAMNQLELVHRVALQSKMAAERRQAEEEQKRSDESLHLLGVAFSHAAEGITVADARLPDYPLSYCNAAFLTMIGYREQEIIGRNCRFLQGVDTDRESVRQVREAVLAGLPCRVTLLNYRKDGTAFWNELSLAPVRDEGGQLTHFIGLQHDVTVIKDAENALEASRAQVDAILESITDGFVAFDKEWRFTYVNDQAERILRRPRAALLGQNAWEAFPDGLGTFIQQEYFQAASEQVTISFEGFYAGLNGWFEIQAYPSETGLSVYFRDVTERRMLDEQKEQALLEAQRRADCDPLTDLLNHRAFQNRLEEETLHALREGLTLAVVLLDLDNFQFFNDVYGHTIGDEVLRLTADKLLTISRPGEVPARYGGDEFVLLKPDVGTATIEEIEAQVRADLDGFFYQLAGQEMTIPLTFSLGAALFPNGVSSRHELLRQADERLRWSKSGGGIEAEAQRVRDFAQTRVSGFSMLDALVTAVDNKDRYTRKHSEDVMHYCILIAQELGMNEAGMQTLRIAALLHDVGKIGVPDAILRKPGVLTDDEFEAVKQHPMMGAIMVSAVPGLEDTLDAVRHHHERWDGGGYPFGLRGEETPLTARLMAVADAYSAMTTDRPYRKGMPPEKAMGILHVGGGTQWDSVCVAAFAKRMGPLLS